MQDALIRIALNADPTWDFRRLVRTQALDLYQADQGTFFWSTDPPTPGAADLGTLLGAFPEDFSAPDSGVAGELASEVRELITREAGRLSVVVILSAADFRVLGAERQADARNWPPDGLSPPGRAAMEALAEAVESLSREEGSEGEFARARSLFWASIAVREAGHQRVADTKAADTLLRLFQARFGHPLGGVVFLSNGEAGNRQSEAEAIQFFKLRAMLDLLGDRDVLARLREVVRGGSRSFWLQMPAPQTCPPMLSDSIARALRKAFEGIDGDDGAIDPEEDSNALAALDRIGAEAKQLTLMEPLAALAQIKRKVSDNPDHLEDSQNLLSAKLDHSDMTAAIAELAGKRRWGIFHSHRRADRIRRLGPIFNSAYANATRSQDASVDAILSADAVENQRLRDRLLAELDRYHAPRSPEGRARLRVVADDLRQRIAQAAERIAQARAARAQTVQDLDGSAGERAHAFAAVEVAEGNMLRARALMHPLIAIAAFAAPPLFWEYARSRQVPGYDAAMALEEIAKSYGPLMLGLVGLVAVISLAVAWRLNRKRLQAQDLLADRLRADWTRVMTASADRLVAASMRRTGGQARLVLNRLEVREDLMAADRLAEFLSQLRPVADTHADRIDPDLERAVNSQIAEAMGKGVGNAARLRAALGRFVPPHRAVLEINAGALQSAPIRIATSATVHEVRLVLEHGAGVFR